MKVSLNNSIQANKRLAFMGFEPAKDEFGEKYYNWSYPYDSNHYDCYLDVYPVTPDKNGDYEHNTFDKPYKNILNGENTIKLQPGNNKIYLDYIFGRVEDAPFAYQYRLLPKNNPDAIPIFQVDPGDLIDKRDFNSDWRNVYDIVVPNGINSGKAGAAILIGADNYDVRYTYDKNGNIVHDPKADDKLNTFKSYANHIGGSLAGVHKALQDGRLDLYSKIFLLPHTSGDKLSSAGYWLESGFQFSSAVDSVDTFTKFQNELFAKGKNLVADSALTSEGMSGIHIQSILQHGEDDVFFDWFKCSSLKDMTAKIGAFGVKNEFIKHKLINPPEIPVQASNGQISFVENRAYKKNEPTYVQVYSADAASSDQIADNSTKIEKYDNPNGSNPLKYGTHNDICMAYSYPINFKTYKHNVKQFNEFNSQLQKENKLPVSMYSYMGTRMLTKFEKFEFENKIDGGFYTWDANVDIAKFDYATSNEDIEEAMNLPISERAAFYAKKEQKRNEVLDYAVSSVKYWTRKTNQALNLYVAQNLKNIDASDSKAAYNKMQNLVKAGILPKKINENINTAVVENVLNDDYVLHGTDSIENYHNEILDGLMNYPLESTEVGKDILALFSTPYITNRATKAEFVGKSRLELLKQRNPHLTAQYEDVYNITTSMYTDSMYNLAQEIIAEVNNKLPKDCKLNKGAATSDYGKYVLPIITQEIAKYAVVKGLFPDVSAEINEDRGGISYDYAALRKKSLKSLGICNTSQKNEAEELVLKLDEGIRKISDSDKKKLVKAVYKMIENTNLKSFQMAEMIVDRTKSGMDWRIDAAKDFSNMDGLRNGADSFEDNWNQVISVLKALNSGIKTENPNSYTVVEITDEVDLYKLGDGDNSERFNWKKAKDKVRHVNGHDETRWNYKNDIIRKLLRESGTDAVANYAFYFTNIAAMFGKKGDDGQDWGSYNRMYNVFLKDDATEKDDDSFLYSGPYDSIVKSYSFVDNHDKPRINHVLSLDMELFFANLNNKYTEKENDFRRRAYRVLFPDRDSNNQKAVYEFDFSHVSSMAVARGEALIDSFDRALNELATTKDDYGRTVLDASQKNKIFDDLKHVIAEMVAGKYKGMHYEANNFGVEEVHKIIKLVLDECALKNKTIDDRLKEIIFNKSFEKALSPALTNSLGMDKFLINSPGIPTTYAGDDTGSTGWERKTKNETQKNRSAVRHDFIEKFKFIRDNKANRDAIYLFRSRPALHALNDGAPYLLKKQAVEEAGRGDVTALLRYSPSDGNAVISLFNTSGVTHDFNKTNDPMSNGVNLAGNRIDLSYQGEDGFIGLHGGLTPGMKFVNAYDEHDVYEVFKGRDDEYYLAKNKDCSAPILLKDNILTLYHADETLMEKERAFMATVEDAKKKGVSFCGNRKRYSNQIYNVAPVSYKTAASVQTGSKLELIK